jgi:DNA-binding response OmpR family regulator
VLRRADVAAAPAADDQALIRAADLTLDPARLSVKRGEEQIELTATEFALLATLARQPGRVFSRAQLLDAVRGVAIESYERAIDTHIKNVRRKIEPDPREPRYIFTVYGVGYKFADA